MNKPPRVIQLSRLRSPKIGRGRPYTVDFGIAKPLYKQLLSKLSSGAHPRWKLVTSRKVRLIPSLIAFYMAVFIPFTTPTRIVYAEPKAPYTKVQPVAQLTMPVLTPVEALQPLIPIVTTPSAPYTLANLYAPGNCTWYVASRLPVPSDWGNAITWGSQAALEGYTVSDVPLAGAVAWSTTDSYLGHVAIVESVVDGVVTISEMNYQGLGVIDSRIANPGEFRYIYL